jgi:vacuolar-type H+-ATPase subunit H
MMEKAFTEALERNRQGLDEQRERIKREAEIARASARGGQKQCRSSHAKNVSLVRSAGV